MRRTTDLVPGPSGCGTSTPTGTTSTPRSQADSTGGEDFLRQLYATHGAAMLRYAVRLLGGDWYSAEDILQEACLRAWKHACTLDMNVAEARPWMFVVVKNLVTDHRRARGIRPPERSALDGLRINPYDDGTIGRFLTRHTVLQAFGDLTEQQREIIKFMYYLECSVAEVAEHLGIPAGTVESRSHYALRALRKVLADRGLAPMGQNQTSRGPLPLRGADHARPAGQHSRIPRGPRARERLRGTDTAPTPAERTAHTAAAPRLGHGSL